MGTNWETCQLVPEVPGSYAEGICTISVIQRSYLSLFLLVTFSTRLLCCFELLIRKISSVLLTYSIILWLHLSIVHQINEPAMNKLHFLRIF